MSNRVIGGLVLVMGSNRPLALRVDNAASSCINRAVAACHNSFWYVVIHHVPRRPSTRVNPEEVPPVLQLKRTRYRINGEEKSLRRAPDGPRAFANCNEHRDHRHNSYYRISTKEGAFKLSQIGETAVMCDR